MWGAAIAAFLFSVSVSAVSRDPLTVNLPEIEIIPRAEWNWVGQHMALNGVPMSIKIFTYRGAFEDVVQFYRSTWKTRGHGKLREDKMGARMIMGYELDGFYYSAQFEQSGSVVTGKGVVTPVPSSFRSSKKSTLPIPPRSTVLSKIESLDLGRREETLSVDSKFDVSYIADFYKDALQRDDWQLVSVGGDERNSAVLNFQRSSELLQLTAKALHHNNSQGTQFLIHWLK